MLKKLLTLIFCGLLVFSLKQEVYAKNNEISAKSYILMESSTGKILSQKNADVKMPMASTTKIMTTLIALEQEDIDTYFTVDPQAILVEGSSMGLLPGDSVNLYSLAVGMILSSGNDGANATAVKIAGNIENFAKLMNEKAKDIGMVNTNFTNPSGLPDDNHYSTAYDMALLAKYAMNNENFKAIASKQNMRVEYGNPPYIRYLSNHNRLLKEYEGAIGIKTGYTKKAGRCLVSAAQRENTRLICVTLNAPNDWNDHKMLFDDGFKKVVKVPVILKRDDLTVNVVGGQSDEVNAVVSGPGHVYLNKDEQLDLKIEIHLNKFYYAPINKGDILGKVCYTYKGNILATSDLVAKTDVLMKIEDNKNGFKDKMKEIFSF